ARADLDAASRWIVERRGEQPDDVLAVATPFLEVLARSVAGTLLAEEVLEPSTPGREAAARFFLGQQLANRPDLGAAIAGGADARTSLTVKTHVPTGPPVEHLDRAVGADFSQMWKKVPLWLRQGYVGANVPSWIPKALENSSVAIWRPAPRTTTTASTRSSRTTWSGSHRGARRLVLSMVAKRWPRRWSEGLPAPSSTCPP